ncbi:thioredoxin domain-containing protein [Diaminobutyricibacter sp. McL0608]|uniref:thioredoxin domain-containing protein n=1 Tax=Leifsonia sp. McL0608 TaxID=3143537 RepID=UPI0031F300C5
MSNRLASAISPYLRSHADNPVDWFPWGADAFAEAERRDVPVLISIGYATCHWCHVMARESFSDPELAAFLNERFVAIKVDREEHPEVDASYLSAASAFTGNLGWPLTVFATTRGRAFFAGTYFPPVPVGDRASFHQVLDAVSEAWNVRREEVEDNAAKVVEAIRAASVAATATSDLPTAARLDGAVDLLAGFEDAEFGGFGAAPKFPIAPALRFLLARDRGADLGTRTLERMAASPLRDPVEGGFFRYATRRDWGDPHYERMLYDNALLLDAYTRAWQRSGATWAATTADGIAGFLLTVMRRDGGGFASAQDSESVIDGERVEGRYYAASAEERRTLEPPPVDGKVLTGWNGLAVAALARAGFAFDRPDWTAAARGAADFLLDRHRRADGTLVRASLDDRTSDAYATLEDYGGLAGGLLALATTTGATAYAVAARDLVDLAMAAGPVGDEPFGVPGGSDPVLEGNGMAICIDPSEGAYPSGLTSISDAAHTLYLLTGERRFERAAREGMRVVAAQAVENPTAFGAALELMSVLADEPEQLVVVTAGDDELGLVSAVRRRSGLVAVVTGEQSAAFASEGFDLFEGRVAVDAHPTAYACRDFVCRMPVQNPAALD